MYNKFQNDLVYLNPRIQTKKIIDGGIQNYCLDHNILFTSNYSNIYNSDSLLFYHNLGVKDIGLSVELSSLEIKELLCSFKKSLIVSVFFSSADASSLREEIFIREVIPT